MRAAIPLLLVALLAGCGEEPATTASSRSTTNSSNYLTTPSGLDQAYAPSTPLYTATSSATPDVPVIGPTLSPVKSGIEAQIVKATPRGWLTKTLEVVVEVQNLDATASTGWVIVTFQPSRELAYQQINLAGRASRTFTFASTKAAQEAEVDFRVKLL